MASRTGSALRARLSSICTALGVVILTLGLLLAYASRVIFNSDAFADRLAASLTEPGVSAFIAERATQGLLARQRDLTAFQPLISASMRALVASEPFRGIVRRAARVSHGAILSGRAQKVALNLEDLGVILHSAIAENPELAGRIPPRFSAFVADSGMAPGGQIAVDFMRIASRFRLSALTLLLVGLGMAVLGVTLSPVARRSVFRLGLSLAIVALVLRLAVRFGGEILACLATDPGIGGATAGMWHAFLGGFMTWALVLGSIGLTLVAATHALFERVEPAEMGRAVWKWFSAPTGRVGTWLARGVVLLLVGGLVSLAPDAAMTILAFLAGLVLVFLGLRELFRVLLRALPEMELSGEAADDLARGGRRPTFVRVILVSAVAAVISGSGAWFLFRASATAPEPRIANACNGYPELCDRRVNEVVFPGAHNAMSAADLPGWLFPNQERSIPVQLREGIRALLVDVHYGMPAGDRVKTILDEEVAARRKYEAVLGKEGIDAAMRIRDRLVGADEGKRGVYLCHGFCELGSSPFVPMLQQIREFLVMNPGEVLMIVVQDEGVTPADIETCFQESGLIDFVYRGPVGASWPTLREMIVKDQRVLVFAENNSAGVSWYHQAYEHMQETVYRFHKPEDFSCRPNRGGNSGSLFLINHWIETAPAPMPGNAEKVNAYDFLLRRTRQCQEERRRLPNLIAVDFYRTGAVVAVARTLNRIEAPAADAGPTPARVGSASQVRQ